MATDYTPHTTGSAFLFKATRNHALTFAKTKVSAKPQLKPIASSGGSRQPNRHCNKMYTALPKSFLNMRLNLSTYTPFISLPSSNS